jgi:hypothetical protein
MPKAYWKIEVQKRFETTYSRYLSGDLTENEITVIIQRLACRHLSEEEIISASLRKPKKTSLLEAARGGPPHGTRAVIWIDHGTTYLASRWKADELPEAPNLSHGDYFVETVVEDADGSN